MNKNAIKKLIFVGNSGLYENYLCQTVSQYSRDGSTSSRNKKSVKKLLQFLPFKKEFLKHAENKIEQM